MRERNFNRAICRLAALFALCIAFTAIDAYAGETSVYFKTGWFEWDEQLNGSSFVKEQGFLHAAGIARKDEVSRFTFNELLEVWGGELDYDGHDVTGTVPIDSSTIYIGTREEFSLGYQALAEERLNVEPFAALGHKFWVRTRSGEDWNLFYAKAGVAGEYRTGGCTLFARGGAFIPIYTRNHVSLSDSGYSDVVVEPKSRVTGFAEGGVRVGAVSVSVEYEAVKFSQSANVPTQRIATGGAQIVDNQAFQPPSDSSLISLKLAYAF
ncbi:hypothetical protein LPW11_14790 [Geomonas sp. RF6]|uniref:hypothetical protein n=1 Tax=Geomonas sp. RF6 TaxID=2897342 RepID=UPI001E47C35C|nr:hypothetical protein [Geomonas sp. RF6]UFS69158.1 hypothetical protein LPW11_14790 [Geomonas sp. RF6]